jgi:hypothetical protein
MGTKNSTLGDKMRKLRIEFRYVDRKTCSRCRTTDKNVERTVQSLRKVVGESGAKIELKTTRLPISRLAQSNSVRINGKDIEELVGRRHNRSTTCYGCSEVLGSSCDCRAYTYRGKKYTYIPRAMIREAIFNSTESISKR